MKKFLHSLLFISIALGTLTACDKDSDLVPEASQTIVTPVEKLVVAYMMAENNLSGAANSDLNEMGLAAEDIPANSRLVVFIDDYSKPRIYEYHNGERRILQTFSQDFCSTDSARVEHILRSILGRFPAKECGLILWSHGSNWVPYKPAGRAAAGPHRSIGIDNGTDTSPAVYGELNIITLKNILTNLRRAWEFIYFDACYMQGIETAYELKDVAACLLGSPAEMPGSGAPYDKLVPELFKSPIRPETLLGCVYDHYKLGCGVMLSAIKTDELEALAAATAPHIARIFAGKTEANISGVQPYSAYCLSNHWRPECFDMNSFMFKHLSPEDYATWLEAFDRAVPVRPHTNHWLSDLPRTELTPVLIDPLRYGGMSMFVPESRFDIRGGWNADFRHTAWYRDAGWPTTGW